MTTFATTTDTSPPVPTRTQVAIFGTGPSGLLPGQWLHKAGSRSIAENHVGLPVGVAKPKV